MAISTQCFDRPAQLRTGPIANSFPREQARPRTVTIANRANDGETNRRGTIKITLRLG